MSLLPYSIGSTRMAQSQREKTQPSPRNEKMSKKVQSSFNLPHDSVYPQADMQIKLVNILHHNSIEEEAHGEHSQLGCIEGASFANP